MTTEPNTTDAAQEDDELTPSRFAWRYLDTEQAQALWDELIDWTTWLRERYELDTKIPPCWYRHGPVVEELTALMAAWTDAYYRGDDYRDDLTSWHTLWFRPLMQRIRTITDFDTCTHHRCDHRPTMPTTLNGIDEFVADDVADRPAPEPALPPTDITPHHRGPAATVVDISAAREVRSIAPDDMDMAVDSGLAEQVDPSDPDGALNFEGVVWVFHTRLGAWVPGS